ncbi:hemin uptake protein HemP [Sulfitobacter sp. 1A13679]|uniref:hemin uptake protein HemP n=1 Tax=Sulfitobacter sp. 1A13679 TaxID=3368597 RepID=UPI0037477C44
MSLMQKLPDPSPAAPPVQEAVHDARALVPNGSTANIVLDGQTYTLRITRAGKLILTK